jgi:hypothetical protein
LRATCGFNTANASTLSTNAAVPSVAAAVVLMCSPAVGNFSWTDLVDNTIKTLSMIAKWILALRHKVDDR